MSTVTEIAHAVRGLHGDDLTAFRAWFDEYLADVWDRQITADAEAGLLDRLGEAARAELLAGRCIEL